MKFNPKQSTMFDSFAEPQSPRPIVRPTDKPTSHAAAVEVAAKLRGYRLQFLENLEVIDRPATAQEISQGCESVRKRAKELVDLGRIVEVGPIECSVTGKMATGYWFAR